MKIWRSINTTRIKKLPLFSLLLSGVFVGSAFLLVWLKVKSLPLVIPLWFSKPWGEQQLAPASNIWVIPFVSLILFLVNFLAINYLARKEIVLYHLLTLSTPLVLGLFFFSLFQIITVST